ncbi:MAG TPA: hypothetical protein V6D35_13755 [Candidatus Sericytochromatia bacterium]
MKFWHRGKLQGGLSTVLVYSFYAFDNRRLRWHEGKNAPHPFFAGLWYLSGYELLCNRWQLPAQLYIMDLLQAT